MHVYLSHFVAVRNARVSAALDEVALMINRCRTDHFVWLFLSAAELL